MSAAEQRTRLIQWVIDTRTLWSQATRTSDLSKTASSALSILPDKDRNEVLKYLRVQDARMALASRLIKRYAISRFCDVPWSEATSHPDANLKPIFRKKDGSEPFIFNVTHQDGLVILLGVCNPPEGCAVGVDVVSPSERSDYDHRCIIKDGWAAYVDTFAEVFGHAEVQTLKDLSFDAKTKEGRYTLLRYFYSLWCLREAYVKMTGEALLASWLHDLNMHGFAPPEKMAGKTYQAWRGHAAEPHLIIDLEDHLERFMIGTVVRDPESKDELKVGKWKNLDVEEIVKFEQAHQ